MSCSADFSSIVNPGPHYLSQYAAKAEDDHAISRNTLLWCSQRFLVILACFQKGSKQSRMGLSIYLSYNGGLRPPVAGRMLSANRPVRASYHLYIMFPVSFPRWRQTPSITARRAVTHRGWHHSQPRGPSMSLHNLPCKLCSNDGSCGGMHAVLPPLTPTLHLLSKWYDIPWTIEGN